MSDERGAYLGWVRVELIDVTLEERDWFFETLVTEAHELRIGEVAARILRVDPDPTPEEQRARDRSKHDRLRNWGD